MNIQLFCSFILDQYIISSHNLNVQAVQMRGVVMEVFVKVANGQ